jgi:hypothetical protein
LKYFSEADESEQNIMLYRPVEAVALLKKGNLYSDKSKFPAMLNPVSPSLVTPAEEFIPVSKMAA